MAVAMLLLGFASVANAQYDQRAIKFDRSPARERLLLNHVQQINRHGHASHVELARALTAPAQNDVERAWLIYRWVAHHLRHDSRLARQIGDPNRHPVESLLAAGGGSCEVYAKVTAGLLNAVGIEVQEVRGLTKSGSRPSADGRLNHAWNVVHLEGRWWVMDPTWGAGYVQDGVFHRSPSDMFFLIPPDMAVLSHFDPQDRLRTQANSRVSLEVFLAMPESAATLAALGVPPRRLLDHVKFRSKAALVEVYSQTPKDLRLVDVPITKTLPLKAQYFRIESAQFEELMVVQGRQWTPMSKKGFLHSIQIDPQRGELLVMGRRPKQTDFEAILSYEVAR